MEVSFINLAAFSKNGGIEKFNRALIKALSESFESLSIYSLYDSPNQIRNDYQLRPSEFQSRGGTKLLESFRIIKGLAFKVKNVNIWGHINLAPLSIVSKALNPNSKNVLIAHGIEVWGDLSWVKKRMLHQIDEVWAVSEFTKSKLIQNHPELVNKVRVFNNTLDPFFGKAETMGQKSAGIDIRKKYKIDQDLPIVYTLCRLSSNEGYKGYDQVLKAISLIEGKKPYYLIAGKYDELEKERIEKLAFELGLSDRLILTGYLEDEEVIPHYQQSDLFIMPSRGEGFGIVYLEAMACGIPVVAGNQDGSVDALKNGKLGFLVDPSNPLAIAEAIIENLTDGNNQKKVTLVESIQKVEAIFGFDIFKSRLLQYMQDLANN